MNYKERLYKYYVTTHFNKIRDISLQSFEKQRKIFRAYYKHYLPKDNNSKILDIGCGYGSFLYFLRKEGYLNSYGIDISQEQIDTAKKFGIENVECIDLMEYLSAHKLSFDCIVALDVVEHFTKKEILALLDAVYSALKPDGIFIMQSPNAEGLIGSSIRYGDFTHELAFTSTSVNQIFKVCGFKESNIYPTGVIIHNLMGIPRWFICATAHLFARLYVLAETGSCSKYILTQNLIAVGKK